MDIILLRDAENFIAHLQKKQARQIVVKIKELSQTGHVQDSKILQGTKRSYFRVDSGEFRIIYQHQNSELLIVLIGRRNDDEIYKLFSKKKG
ncbi:MAG: toxin [Rickettsia endosymbiont of Pseudomimeciton antennatum]|nr:toxin [Rickettsia endosymbiont of Pseudomimeciton antennatum]